MKKIGNKKIYMDFAKNLGDVYIMLQGYRYMFFFFINRKQKILLCRRRTHEFTEMMLNLAWFY